MHTKDYLTQSFEQKTHSEGVKTSENVSVTVLLLRRMCQT